MIKSTIDVIRRLTEMLESNFPNIAVSDTDITEGFQRPSFFIDVLSVNSETIGTYMSDSNEVNLYYFAPNLDSGYLDLLEVKNKLRYLLTDNYRLGEMNEDGSEQEGFNFVIATESVEFVVSQKDKTLQCIFNVDLVQDDDREDNVEPVDTIEFTLTPIDDTQNTIHETPSNDSDSEEFEEDFIKKL